MSKLPEGRKSLSWQDMPFADKPKNHPSTERLEIEKLQERVAELEAALQDIADGMGEMTHREIGRFAPSVARAALKGKDDE